MVRGLFLGGALLLVGCGGSSSVPEPDGGQFAELHAGADSGGGAQVAGGGSSDAGSHSSAGAASVEPIAGGGSGSAGAPSTSGGSGSAAGAVEAGAAAAGAPDTRGGSGGADVSEAGQGGAVAGAAQGGASFGGSAAGSPSAGAAGAACGCTTGQCCDGCQFRPSSYFLGEFVKESSCYAGKSLDQDYWNLFCDGVSSTGTRWGAHSKSLFGCQIGEICVDPDGPANAYCTTP